MTNNGSEINEPSCIQVTLRIMGDKWTGLILQKLTTDSLTFSQLEVTLHPISPRTLSQRLDYLEKEEIIEKRMYCEHPPRFKYSLSRKGTELEDVLRKMVEWGSKYSSPTPLA